MHNLGVGDMSLYNHVRNKEDLLAGVSELVWAEAAAAINDHATTRAGCEVSAAPSTTRSAATPTRYLPWCRPASSRHGC